MKWFYKEQKYKKDANVYWYSWSRWFGRSCAKNKMCIALNRYCVRVLLAETRFNESIWVLEQKQGLQHAALRWKTLTVYINKSKQCLLQETAMNKTIDLLGLKWPHWIKWCSWDEYGVALETVLERLCCVIDFVYWLMHGHDSDTKHSRPVAATSRKMFSCSSGLLAFPC